jgi:hypothetical protein
MMNLKISTIFSILYALLLQKHIQSHIPNKYNVINKIKWGAIHSVHVHVYPVLTVGEQYSKILHNMHFDHVI